MVLSGEAVLERTIMDYWAEFRTTMMVAKLGSASAAASALGLHRSTVSRHVDTVEATLGATLFIRHARGVKLTDAGQEMLTTAGHIEDMFVDLQGRLKKQLGQISGELVVTSLQGVASLIMPAIRAYKAAYPEASVSFVSGPQLAQLEYGEAHVAIRAGARPTIPDYVVRPFRRVRFGFYGHREYVHAVREKKNKKKVQLTDYTYIGATDDSIRAPYVKWLRSTVAEPKLALRVNDFETNLPAVLARLGVGVLPENVAEKHDELLAVVPPSDSTSVPLWILTHRDLRKTAKVQEFVRILKESCST